MLETHEGLAAFTKTLASLGTASGVGLAGWVAYMQLQKIRIDEKFGDLKKSFSDQSLEINNIKDSQQELITINIERAVRPIIDGQTRIESKLDNFIASKIKK